MLMSTLSNRYAHALLKARAAGTLMSPLTDETDLTIADAYDIARTILDTRIAQGEEPIGRKIGFSNRKTFFGEFLDACIVAAVWQIRTTDWTYLVHAFRHHGGIRS